MRASTEDEADSDADLLERVARKDADPVAARAAQAALYQRHVRYLYGVLLRRRKDLMPLAGLSAEDLVQETFHRAFERAHTFQRAEGIDADRDRMRTRAWLGRIAQNLLVDHLQAGREISATPYLERVTCEAIDDDAPPSSQSPKRRLMSEALEQLSERERDVLRVSALHFRAGDHQRLPNAVSAELASRWETTGENIRAIRVRAMKKLRAYLTAKGLGAEEAT